MLKREDLLDEIVNKVKTDYDNFLNCEEERANLFLSINGVEQVIHSIDLTTLYFEDDDYNVELIDADISHLVYINSVI
jgi:hypothetical protein